VIVTEDRGNKNAYILYNYGEIQVSEETDDGFLIGWLLGQPNGEKISFIHACSFDGMGNMTDFESRPGNTSE